MITRRRFLSATGLAAASAVAGRAAWPAVVMAPSAPFSEPVPDAFTMPAEWAPHQGCVMALTAAWNHYDSREIDAIRLEQAAVARAIRRFEPVTMLANPEDRDEARRLCGPDIAIATLSHYDGWTRDTLPTVVRAGEGNLWAIGWNFNAWGGAFDGYEADTDLAERFAAHAGLPFRRAAIVAEPGAFETDGAGTVLASEPALLDPRRNEGRSRADIEDQFHRYLGARTVVWLPGSPADVVTDGHMDTIAKFLAPGKLVVEVSDDPDDPEYADLKANRRRLAGLTDAAGRAVETAVIKRPRRDFLGDEGIDATASYVNCYIANGGIILPEFGDLERDAAARDVMSRLSGGLPVVTVRIEQIRAAAGGIHRLTQQIPAVAEPPFAP
jgi:agmatine deiminase